LFLKAGKGYIPHLGKGMDKNPSIGMSFFFSLPLVQIERFLKAFLKQKD